MGQERTTTPTTKRVLQVKAGKFSMRIEQLRAGVVLVATAGYDEGLVFGQFAKFIEEEYALCSTGLKIYADMRALQGMNADAREQAGAFGRKRREWFRSVLILSDSRMVDMAVSLIGLAMGGGLLRSTRSEATFLQEVSAEVPLFTRLPPPPL